jgi:uncharacterized protein with HEPN domain
MRSDRERLLDIKEAISKIEERKADKKSDFDSEELLQIWTVHYLQIIGEAASRITQEFRDQHPDIPWGQMIGMRHILVHGYFEIDLDIVWTAVVKYLPSLKMQIQSLLDNFDFKSNED